MTNCFPEFAAALGAQVLDKNVQIELAYKTYVDEGFVIKPTYKEYLKEFFKAGMF